ncbi:hypothetical protein Bca101_096310 [Brassica carinata]
MIDEDTDEYIHHGERGSVSAIPGSLTASNTMAGGGSVSAVPGSLTASNAMAGGGSVANSSAAEQGSISFSSTESSAEQGSVSCSNSMAGGGSVVDSSAVKQSSVSGSSAAGVGYVSGSRT